MCMGLTGVTRMSWSLPLTLSSTMVWSAPAHVVTGTIPSIPERTHASIRFPMPSMSGYASTSMFLRNRR